MDRASNAKGVGVGVVLITLEGEILEQSIMLGFPASNNETEYKTLLMRL